MLDRMVELQKRWDDALVDAAKANAAKENTADHGGAHRSLREIVGGSGKSYGTGVYLDSALLENLSNEERTQMVKERVKELGGQGFTAYDAEENAATITIAKPNARYRGKSGKRVPVNRDLTTKYIRKKTKQEAVVLADELIVASKKAGKQKSRYAHGWLDNNGENAWEYWSTYIQDKNNTVWEATLNVARPTDGDRILYDVDPIKMVEGPVESGASTTNQRIVQASTTSQEKSGESALYQRRDNTRTERDVLSDAADGDAANVRETVTGAGCSAIWTDRPTGEKTFLAETAKESAADHGGVQHSDCQSLGGLGRDFRESASVS